MEHTSFYSEKSPEQCDLEEELQENTSDSEKGSTDEQSEKKEESFDSILDFDYILDKNGDPVLLIPDNNPLLVGKDSFIKVDHEQTTTHLHHAPELGIDLPKDFDMEKYLALRGDRQAQIEYAKQHVSRETIIEYQNAIGKAMFQGDPTPVPGFAGKRKRETELKIKTVKKDEHILSIIREDGVHISSYTIKDDSLRRLVRNDFLVLKDRDI